MQLSTIEYGFEFLTPCFSGTAEGRDAALSELRVPPIRGHIRFWHRAAFGNPSANQVWGSANGNEGQGSRVAIRISSPTPTSGRRFPLLPHHPQRPGLRPALPDGSNAGIQLQRFPGCTNDDWDKANAAARLWLIAGTLGYRATRAAGSVWPLGDWAPKTREDLAGILAPLVARPSQPWGAALAGEAAVLSWADLRKTASDTPAGPPNLFGGANPRKPSPVRFKVVRLAGSLRLLAMAPSRESITHAEAALNNKPDPRRWVSLGPWQRLWR